MIIKGSVPTAACSKAGCQASVAAGTGGLGGHQRRARKHLPGTDTIQVCGNVRYLRRYRPRTTRYATSSPLFTRPFVNKNEHPTVNGDT